MPVSINVGTSGSASTRVREVVTSPRSVPEASCDTTVG
jgi:hypothetical protein